MAISIFRGIGSAIGVPAQALPKPKSASKFRDIAYCGTFRSDGKLLAAGDATGKVTVFEAATATLLRELAGHKDATRVVAWAEVDVAQAELASGRNRPRGATRAKLRINQHGVPHISFS